MSETEEILLLLLQPFGTILPINPVCGQWFRTIRFRQGVDYNKPELKHGYNYRGTPV